jgi:putative DNA primase/helicase
MRPDPAAVSAKVYELMHEEDEREPVPPEYSDDALAAAFTRLHGDELRYVAAWGKWLRYDGRRWAEDRTIAVFDLVRTTCRHAAGDAEEKIARQIASAKTIASVEKLARSDPQHAAVPEAFDSDIFLLNTPGGTVDLRNGQLRPHRREDMLSLMTAVSPDEDSEDGTLQKFLQDITLEDEELEGYLRRLIGYCLTGDVRDHVLVFCHGGGANGKSTFLDMVLYVLGDYARQIPTETLMEARGERHPTEIANLKGVRLAVSSEVEEGQHWAESRIKALTGDAVLTGRYMRQNFFEFRRTHKLVVAGNHKPSIRTVDDAMRRRVHLVPFRAKFAGEKVDSGMPVKLRAEAPAMLAWAIRGCLEWQAGSLNPPLSVLAATSDYLNSQDTLGLWLAECCDTSDPTAETRSSSLYESYRAWKEGRGERAPSTVRFSALLEARHHKELRGGFVRFQGVALRDTGGLA